ncbi:MAG: PDZ domain-containing protein [Truepera sp.]|nr:PDZ domain-containing protein [Truepera sp.]
MLVVDFRTALKAMVRHLSLKACSSTLGALALLLGNAAAANPAQDLFDEAVYFLSLLYGGTAEVRPQELAPKFQAELDTACAVKDEPCPFEAAWPVIDALVKALGDPHTNFYPGTTFEEILSFLGAEGVTLQFGLVVRPIEGRVGLAVLEVLPDSPAAGAGLRRGDRILALEGRYLFGPDRVAKLYEAQGRGEPTRMRLERVGERFSVTLKPRELSRKRLPSLTYLPKEAVGLLRIPSFLPAGEVASRLHALVREAQSEGVRALVIDLRDNPGGHIRECLGGADAFVDGVSRKLVSNFAKEFLRVERGTLYVRRGEGREFASRLTDDPARFDGPTVAIVNRYTGSCAEFFALDLQEGGIPVVGEPTFGVANTATTFVGLSGGSGLQISIARALREDGSLYPERVEPNRVFDDDLETLIEGRDVLLEAALELISGRLENEMRALPLLFPGDTGVSISGSLRSCDYTAQPPTN